MSTAKIDPEGQFAANLAADLRALGTLVGEVNVANGWDTSRAMIANPDAYDPKWQVAHKIAELGLIDTEVSEAIEEVRHGHSMNEVYYGVHQPECRIGLSSTNPADFGVSDCTCVRKPEGVPSELADVIIRVLDIADAYSIDLGAAVVEKLNHNATRGLHHGGKAL